MDDLLREFLTETSESLDTVDNQLVKFEQEPNNAKILDNIFRLVHTIKGTCGFLGLSRLEALKAVNPNIRDDELAAIESNRQQVMDALAQAGWRLDALRLIVVTHQ